MKKNKNFFGKLLAVLKEFLRKFLVTLKKHPNYIPLVMLLISFVVYSFNLTSVSDTTATVQGKFMGMCEFATMLFSILSMIAMLNAFPKRKKPNYLVVALILVLCGIIIFADYVYVTKLYTFFVERGDSINVKYYDAYMTTYNMLYTHIVLMVITAATVILEPLFAKLLKKINTTVELEETNIGNIELSEEE